MQLSWVKRDAPRCTCDEAMSFPWQYTEMVGVLGCMVELIDDDNLMYFSGCARLRWMCQPCSQPFLVGLKMRDSHVAPVCRVAWKWNISILPLVLPLSHAHKLFLCLWLIVGEDIVAKVDPYNPVWPSREVSQCKANFKYLPRPRQCFPIASKLRLLDWCYSM